MNVLTADLVARAVIAGAVHYGDDPERALTVRQGILKRSLKAVAFGLQEALGGDANRYARLIGLEPRHIYKGRDERVAKASAAVAEAVRYALGPTWKPPLAELPRVEGFARKIEAVLPQLFGAHPRGATSWQIANLTGLKQPEAAEGARRLQEEKIARWERSGNKNLKFLRPWDFVDARPASPPPAIAQLPRLQPPAKTAIAAHVVPPRPAPNLRDAAPTGTLGSRICRMLRGTDASTQGLATLLDAKELLVSQSLVALEREGVVVADPMPPAGRRFQRWRLREDIAA